MKGQHSLAFRIRSTRRLFSKELELLKCGGPSSGVWPRQRRPDTAGGLEALRPRPGRT